ncbi:conserved hypothetical protein [Neospora caninum Liverpool]|uniref:Transmembrane protein n=1 Tax=Neospora caninum (strain Liverpool) TaxID=572307 RepID=F0VD80_NEOCL|nr:conserved hypothetical protein [Neospora caninum Liverpool]CBZ51595.1 conserved hypothetical protein [Neospora caninum Liverpool]CEL65546.1 TPA: hypothetical protein BN1204_013890 [Neospora caninum Liverpool]|eukprot:XP_003881628.1 conserved hypothetical protein [Neospora caninum Liverpool]
MAMASRGSGDLLVATRWLGLIAGALTLVQWCFILPSKKVSLSVADGDFLRDVNKDGWRFALFSFVPEVFIDVWTPFVMGLISVLCHFNFYSIDFNSKNFAVFFVWNCVLALFGNLGYCGGIGIISGSVSLITSFLSLICFILDRNADARLHIDKRP